MSNKVCRLLKFIPDSEEVVRDMAYDFKPVHERELKDAGEAIGLLNTTRSELEEIRDNLTLMIEKVIPQVESELAQKHAQWLDRQREDWAKYRVKPTKEILVQPEPPQQQDAEAEAEPPKRKRLISDPRLDTSATATIIAPPPPAPPQSPPRTEKAFNVNLELHKLSTRTVAANDLHSCFMCIAAGGCSKKKGVRGNRVKAISFRTKERANANAMLKAYVNVADQLRSVGVVPLELRPFFLCGNHLNAANVEIDVSVLADRYIEFCSLLDKDERFKADPRVVRILRSAVDVSAPGAKRRRTTTQKKMPPPEAEAEAEAEDESSEEYVGDAENHEDVEQMVVEPEDVSKLLEVLLSNRHLRELKLEDLGSIFNRHSPYASEAQVVSFSDELKMALVCNLEDDPEADLNLFMAFYGPKYSGVDDATYEHQNTHWLPLNDEVLKTVGYPDAKIESTIGWATEYAHSILQRKHQ